MLDTSDNDKGNDNDNDDGEDQGDNDDHDDDGEDQDNGDDDIVSTCNCRSSCCGKACRLIHLLALPCQVFQTFHKNFL